MSIVSLFDYDQNMPLQIREVGTFAEKGIVRRLFTYMTPFGVRRVANVIGPQGEGALAAVLYVHWYEPEAHNANRTQFVDEAVTLAEKGAVSLLVETMWSDRDWFIKRTQADDEENSIRQVIELRQAMDLLLAQLGVDAARFAYVGHDFGAMYGVLAGHIDPRPTCYVLMAGTPRFSDWYLYYPKLEGEEQALFIERMARFDPINHVAALAPAPLFFQFAQSDPHVPQEEAQSFYEAAGEPKQVGWYDAGHGLNEQAAVERIAWLSEQLSLSDG